METLFFFVVFLGLYHGSWNTVGTHEWDGEMDVFPEWKQCRWTWPLLMQACGRRQSWDAPKWASTCFPGSTLNPKAPRLPYKPAHILLHIQHICLRVTLNNNFTCICVYVYAYVCACWYVCLRMHVGASSHGSLCMCGSQADIRCLSQIGTLFSVNYWPRRI